MSFTEKNFSNARPTTLLAAVDNQTSTTTLPVNAPSDAWPAPPYTITIDRGYAYQEVCLVTAATPAGHPTSLTATRNFDGNGIFPHGGDAVVEISATAGDWKAFNLHNVDQTRDDHPSLMKTDGTRHDLTNRHYMGTSLPTGPPSESGIGDVYQEGSAAYLARADHVHGREADTYTVYTNSMMVPGLVFPVSAAVTDPRFLLCNGGWYQQSAYPRLYAAIGHSFAPVSGIANPGTGIGAYNAAIHFAVPILGQYVNGVMTWNYLGTKWAITADS
jgi:hypothetical protein